MTTRLTHDAELDQARREARATWEAAAPGWEQRRDYLRDFSAGITDWLVDQLDPRPGKTILELAAGPGDTGFAAARRVIPGGRLLCTDFAPSMVDVARRRAAELGVGNVEFRVLDAEDNDLPDRSVDGVLCRWGYSLMLDPARAFGETRRVLRDGGRLCLTVMGTPPENPWGFRLVRSIVGLGLIPPPDPRHPGGLFSLADHDDLRPLLENAGFTGIRVEDAAFRLRFADFDDYWRFILEFAGAVSVLLKNLSPEQVTAVREAAESALTEYRTGTGYEFPGATVNAAATAG